MTDPDRVAAEAAVQAIRTPDRPMHACPNPTCPAEYATAADATRCGASHKPTG